MYVVGQLPLKELMVKMTMQAAVLCIARMDNELAISKFAVARCKEFLNLEIQDFVVGFDRRILLLISNAFILNSPKDLLNGNLLKKLVKTGKKFKVTKNINRTI